MSKKTRSDPHGAAGISDGESGGEATVFIQRRLESLRKTLESRPITIYIIMVAAMAISAILSFLVLKPAKRSPETIKASVTTVFSSGLGDLASTASALKDLLELQQVVNGLMDRDSLGTADSLVLDSALTRMQQIEKQIKNMGGHPSQKPTAR